jgi:hypothetical protein
MKKNWVLEIRDQCLAAGVPFFFKQWGGVNRKKTGRLLDGRTWDELPQQAQDCGESQIPLIFTRGRDSLPARKSTVRENS